MPKFANVIIIGGGIIGAASAYYLSLKGIKVIVLEQSDNIGDGGSSRNGGGVRQSGRDPRELPLVMYGVKNIWPQLSKQLDLDIEYVQGGNLRLGKTEKHLEILKKLTARSINAGLDVQMINEKKARKICPSLSDEVIGASWCPTDGHANPLLTTLAFYRKARDLGTIFITGENVIKLHKIKGHIRQVITEDEIYEADSVIVAAGYNSRKLLETVGIDIPMSQLMLEALVTEAQPKMFNQMLGTAMADFYGHQTNHGSFVFGGASGFESTNKDNGTPIATSLTASCICRGIMKYFPVLKDVKIVRTWAGWADFSADGIPVISQVEEVPGLIIACGFTGHGFGIAPTVGLLVSQLVNNESPILDLTAFKYDRFKTKI